MAMAVLPAEDGGRVREEGMKEEMKSQALHELALSR